MDKKKQFQLQNLKSKLNNYEKSLNELIKQRNNIVLNATSDTTPDTTLDTTLNTTLDNFQSKKNDIETQIIQTKTNISSGKYELVNLINKLKLLPEQLQNNISDEINIYNEEQCNLDNTITDTIQIHLQNIENSKTDKNTLGDEICNLENQIKEQHSVISDIQTNAHHSRKNILQELHNKKQQKISLQEQINTIQSNNNIYQNTIDDLNTINTFLIQTKRDLINYFYDVNNAQSYVCCNSEALQNIINSIGSFELLKSYNITINTGDMLDSLDSPDSPDRPDRPDSPDRPDRPDNLSERQNYLRNFVNNFDEIVNSNTSRIQSITHKSDKAKIKTDIHIENIRKDQDQCAFSRNKTKTLSYKDSYKMEKNKKTELQNRYNDLQNLYNNYESLVINKLQDAHNSSLLELNNHKSRAEDRLNIMKDRLQNNYQQNKSNLEEQIKTITGNLLVNSNFVSDLHKQLLEVNANLSTLDKNKNELQQIEKKIKDITQVIKKLKNDIEYVELGKQ
jgi:chromosome segregation ATPase